MSGHRAKRIEPDKLQLFSCPNRPTLSTSDMHFKECRAAREDIHIVRYKLLWRIAFAILAMFCVWLSDQKSGLTNFLAISYHFQRKGGGVIVSEKGGEGVRRMRRLSKGRLCTIIHGMLESSGFRKYSTLLVTRCLCLCIHLCLIFVFLIHFWIAIIIKCMGLGV